MTTTAPRDERIVLRALHKQIDLYDRKLEHLDKYLNFATAGHLLQTRASIVTRRGELEKTARLLAASGVAFSDADLPRSFRIKTDFAEG
ncbi:MAG: hypothetical protein KGN79_01110 [Acidobacteriota bacterium]|nr:hypothetical protein [Acidobacteriota bacterium]